MSGKKWRKVDYGGARFKFIKYLVKLFHFKKSAPNNSNKNKSDLAEIKEKEIKRNKFGFPIYIDYKNRNR
jgi:hypothetical protein